MSLRLPVGFFNAHFECAPTPTLEKKIYLKFAKKKVLSFISDSECAALMFCCHLLFHPISLL